MGGPPVVVLSQPLWQRLFARSLANILAFPFGFDSRQLLIFRIELPGEACNDRVKRTSFRDAPELRSAAIPGQFALFLL